MDKNKTISRRDFFKQIGAASVAVAGFSACGKGNKAETGSAEPLGACPATAGTKITGKPAALSSWAMTEACPACAKPTIASDADSATRIVRKASTSRKKCNASTIL